MSKWERRGTGGEQVRTRGTGIEQVENEYMIIRMVKVRK